MPRAATNADAARADPIASGIRAARAWAGYTAEELADVIGSHRDRIYSYEQARRKPSAAMRQAIADACGTPLWLVEGGIQGLSKNGRGTK